MNEVRAGIALQNRGGVQERYALFATELSQPVACVKVELDLFRALPLMNLVIDGPFTIAEWPDAAQMAQEILPEERDVLIVSLGSGHNRIGVTEIFIDVSVAFPAVGIGLQVLGRPGR